MAGAAGGGGAEEFSPSSRHIFDKSGPWLRAVASAGGAGFRHGFYIRD